MPEPAGQPRKREPIPDAISIAGDMVHVLQHLGFVGGQVSSVSIEVVRDYMVRAPRER